MNRFVGLLFLVLLLLITNVYAFGIIQDYLPQNTLKLTPGTSYTVNLYLQNFLPSTSLLNPILLIFQYSYNKKYYHFASLMEN